MQAMQSRFLVILTMAALLNLPTTNWAQDNPVQERPTAAGPAEASVTLDEMSPGQVIVTYQDGELTIKARNAPLLEVLRKVCSEIGAEFDSSAGSSEPIFADLGPGPAREVLSSFLSGSRFNYAMQASAEDPNVLARLIIFPKTGSSHPQKQVTQLQGSSAPVAAPVASSAKESRAPQAQQMKELLAQAKTEIAQLGSAPEGMDEGDASALKANADEIFGLFENSIKQAESADANASQAESQPVPSAGDTTPPVGRRRHRRRR